MGAIRLVPDMSSTIYMNLRRLVILLLLELIVLRRENLESPTDSLSISRVPVFEFFSSAKLRSDYLGRRLSCSGISNNNFFSLCLDVLSPRSSDL